MSTFKYNSKITKSNHKSNPDYIILVYRLHEPDAVKEEQIVHSPAQLGSLERPTVTSQQFSDKSTEVQEEQPGGEN